MKIDIELSAVLNISGDVNRDNINQAISDAIDKLDVTFDGYIHIPESSSNEDIFEMLEIEPYNYPEGFYFPEKGIIFVREGTPNKEMKRTLITVEDD